MMTFVGCPLTGYPELTIQWTFKGKVLKQTNNSTSYRLMHSNKVLQINRFNNESVGDYSCKGSNIGGVKEINLQLNITGWYKNSAESNDLLSKAL